MSEPQTLVGLRVVYAAFEGLPNRKGSGVRIRQMLTALTEAGAEVTLFALTGAGGPPLPNAVHFSQIKLEEQNYLSRALAFRDEVARRLYAARPDVIHFRGPFEGQAAVDCAKRTGAKTIFEVNGLPSVELRYHYPHVASATAFETKIRAQEQEVLRKVSRVMTQSGATARFATMRAQLGTPPTVIPNGADPALFAPPEVEPSDEHLRILYAGSLAPWQGLLDLFSAVRDRRHHYDLRLTVIGPGRRTWRRALTRQARRMKVDRVLEMVEATDQATLSEQLRRSHICAAPLRRDLRNRVQGCSPIKLFEYMAAGRAVLSTDLPCVREIIAHEESGLLARPSNPHRLRDALSVLAEDKRLRARLGKNARKRIVEGATWTHRRAQLVALYEALIKGDPARTMPNGSLVES